MERARINWDKFGLMDVWERMSNWAKEERSLLKRGKEEYVD